jgi:histidinol-phosphate aminotransferase
MDQTMDPSRRRFAGALGSALGAVATGLPGPAAASLAPGDAPGLVRLDSNENPWGPPPVALEAAARAQADWGRYPDAAEQELVLALARHHGVSPERVVLGCGSSDVLRMADHAFLGPGKTVVAARPTFEAVLAYARVTRAEAVTVPLDASFRHDLDAMARTCDSRTGLVYVCNPNNPTGTIVPGRDLEAFLARVPSTAAVLVDEAYHHFVEDPSYRSAASLLDRFPNVVVARTFSKIYGLAGMRLGYALATEANARALRGHASWSNANAAVLAAGRACLADESLVPHLRERLNGERRRLCAALERDGRLFIPSEANFVMIDVGSDVGPLVEAFRARGVLVGRRFGPMPTWLRVSVGKPAETDAFLAVLRQLVPARRAA